MQRNFICALFCTCFRIQFQFYQVKSRDRITDQLAINWKNFAQIRLQLKFAFTSSDVEFNSSYRIKWWKSSNKDAHGEDARLFSKRKLKLESNLSEILPVNCKFIRGSILT